METFEAREQQMIDGNHTPHSENGRLLWDGEILWR